MFFEFPNKNPEKVKYWKKGSKTNLGPDTNGVNKIEKKKREKKKKIKLIKNKIH